MLNQSNSIISPTHWRLRYGKHQESEIQAALVAKQEADVKVAEEQKVTPWQEPETVEVLMDMYIVEGKFSGRAPGTTLYLMNAKKRDGTTDQIQPNQRFKLFLVTWLLNSTACVVVYYNRCLFWLCSMSVCHELIYLHCNDHPWCSDGMPSEVAHCAVTIGRDEYQIAHGPSKFIKPEKVANMQRQENSPPDLC